MNRPTKHLLAPLVWALLTQATAAGAAEKQAWLVETEGFAQKKTADLVLRVEDGKYWATQKDMETLGFNLSKLSTVNGLIDLSSTGTLSVDELNQTISLKVKIELLPESNLDFRGGLESMPPTPTISGGFLNYDIRADRDDRTRVTSLFDASTFITEDIRANAQTLVRSGYVGRQRRVERVHASLSKNDLDKSLTWTAGDAYSSGGQGVNPVNFTGFQVKRNFGLRSGFVSQPTYDLKGSAAAPSALDVYIDNRKVMSSQIPAGPFSLRNLVGLEGASSARIVTRDAFGQEQVITETLLGGPELLKKELSSFALQGGVMRLNNTETDGKFASAYYRYGFTNFLTAELNAEKSFEGRLLPDVSHVGAAVAVSTALGNFGWTGRRGTGTIATYSYQNGIRKQSWSAHVNASDTKASRDYTILGARTPNGRSRSALQASLLMDNGFGLSALHAITPTDINTSVTANYRRRAAYATTYSLTMNRSTFAGKASTSLFLSASIPLHWANTKRTRSANARIGENAAGVLTQSLEYYDAPIGMMGTSFKLREEGPRGAMRVDTEATRRSTGVEVGIATSSDTRATGYRAHVRGAIILHDGRVGFTRHIDSGYTVVDGGAPGIKVLVNGQSEGKTDSAGFAYVPVLMPYMRTGISLDPETVPINYDNNTENVSTRIGGGAKVVFRGIIATMLSIPGITEGSIKVNDLDYPITDRGVFMELPAGKYSGTTDKGKTVNFEVPATAKNGLSYVKGTIHE